MILSHDTDLAGTTQSSNLRIYTLQHDLHMICWFSMYNLLKKCISGYPDRIPLWPFSRISVIYVKYRCGSRRDRRQDGTGAVRQERLGSSQDSILMDILNKMTNLGNQIRRRLGGIFYLFIFDPFWGIKLKFWLLGLALLGHLNCDSVFIGEFCWCR